MQTVEQMKKAACECVEMKKRQVRKPQQESKHSLVETLSHRDKLPKSSILGKFFR